MKHYIFIFVLSIFSISSLAQKTLYYRSVPADDLRETQSFNLYMSGNFSIVKYSDGTVRSLITNNSIYSFDCTSVLIGLYSPQKKLIKKIQYEGYVNDTDFVLCDNSQYNTHQLHESLGTKCECTPYSLSELWNFILTHTGYVRIVANLEDNHTIDTSFWTVKSRKPIKK